jgi:putative aldouronate transport system permease protein
MFLPVAIYFIVFLYLPMPGIIIAFKNYNFSKGIFRSDWCGFENFRYFFKSGKLLLVTANTVVYNLIFLSFNTIVAVISGMMIYEMSGKYFKKTAQSFMFLPYFISWVTVSAFVYNIFNYDYGLLNNFLKSNNIRSFNLYSNPSIWYVFLPILYIWKNVGFSSVIYLSAIMSIDQTCFESAKIDGANVYQRMRYITLPFLKPTIITLLLLGLSRIMRGEFDMFYQLIGNNGLLYDKTDIIDTLVFRSLVGISDFGMAASAGLYQSMLCFLIILSINYIVRKTSKEYALF